MADEAGLDLVEIAPNSEPPVCKILDLGKLKYANQKKAAEARKKQKIVEIKEIKMRPNIDTHDYDVKMKAMNRFLEDGDKVKVTLKFRGREMAHQELGMKLLLQVKDDTQAIAKVEADAFPVIWLAFTSDTLSSLQINDLIQRIAKPRLQTVTGVADVRIFGERKYAMRVWLDPDKLAGYRLTTQDVEDAIRRSNLELPAGRIESQQREFSVTSQTDLLRPSQFEQVVIRNVGGFPVKLGSKWWAQVEITLHEIVIVDGVEVHRPLPGVLVTGTWGPPDGTTESCRTQADLGGRCPVGSKTLKNAVSSMTFTITSVAHSDYQAGRNHDPDGDSDIGAPAKTVTR